MTKSARGKIEEFLRAASLVPPDEDAAFYSMWLLDRLSAAGYVIVPKEASEGMIEVGGEVEMKSYCEGDPTANYPDVPSIYKAMLLQAERETK